VSQGLALFQGGVLMVSHDQHLIESTVDELWAVENGTGEGVCSLGIWLAVLVAPIGAC
jgi:ATPase subunit of ABC transporter with duplicated ATPase domains